MLNCELNCESVQHFTEVKIDADILQHSLELLTQYSENSLRESIDRGGDTAGSGADTAGAAGEDNTSQNSSPTSTAKVQHKLHVRGTILWPRGKCKVYDKKQTSNEGAFLNEQEKAPLAVSALFVCILGAHSAAGIRCAHTQNYIFECDYIFGRSAW